MLAADLPESVPPAGERHVSHVDAGRGVVLREGRTLRVLRGGSALPGHWIEDNDGPAARLLWQGPEGLRPDEAQLLAALEAAFVLQPGRNALLLPAGLLPQALDGLARGPGERQHRLVERAALWQLPRLWLPRPRQPHPVRHVSTQGIRHPLRPAKPEGTVYRRHIGWLDMDFSLRAVEPEQDLPAFHRWMNDPAVACFWEEQGELGRHRAYLDRVAADPHATGLIGCLDGQPFAYFEVYWAREDRIAPFYDAADHDRGWHALVGEPRFRGRPFLTAWLPSISHYLFLDDCRTQRIVIEPRADNQKMRKSLPRCGYALLKEFDFPHKRAVLGMLSRKRFFSEALWIPQSGAAAPPPPTP